MKKITKETKGVTIEFIPENEDESPSDLLVGGDPEYIEQDRTMVKEICDRSNNGDPWALFCAHVKITYTHPKFGEIKADDYLGCCSYNDEADFKAAPYYSDMVDTCLADVNAQVAAKYAEVRKAKHVAKCRHCSHVTEGKKTDPTNAGTGSW